MNDPGVKERADAIACTTCGRPTWSASGLCFACRRVGVEHPPAGPPLAPRPEVVLDDAGRLAEEISCRACGYTLRGLRPDDVCPECGASVERSIRGDLLAYSDPAWVRRLARGVRVILIAIGVMIGTGVIFIGAMFAGARAGAGLGGGLVIGQSLIGGLLSLALFIGVWLLTTPDPARSDRERTLSPRRIARWGFLAELVEAPLQTLGNPMGAMSFGNPVSALTPALSLLMLVGMAATAIVVVAEAAGFLYLRSLALRVPKPRLARSTTIAMWGFVTTQAFGIVLGVLTLAMMPALMAGPTAPRGIPPSLMAVAAGGCAYSLSALVFTIWLIALLMAYAAQLRKAVREAESHWTSVIEHDTAGAVPQ